MKHFIFSYHEMMIWEGERSILAPLKYIQVVQCWGFTTGLGFCLLLLFSPAIEPSSVLPCRLELVEKCQLFVAGNWRETLLSLNYLCQLFPMKN